MASSDKQNRPKARLAKGFRDVDANEIRGLKRMLRTIEGVYENYGFEPVEQPFIEYTEALGKFLPDQDRPNEGVFSFQDDDEQWLSLHYDRPHRSPATSPRTNNSCTPFAATARAGSSATKNQAPLASANSCSSTPTP